MKRTTILTAALLSLFGLTESPAQNTQSHRKMEQLNLTQEWDKTGRGYHPRSINSGLGWNQTSHLAFLNAPILAYADEIRSAVLLIHGEKAHSRYFSEFRMNPFQSCTPVK